MNERPTLWLCAYVLLLSTAAWATQSQQLVWSVGGLSALAFIGRAGTCRDCGQWVAVAHEHVATRVLMPRVADQAVAVRPVAEPPLPVRPPNATRKPKLPPGPPGKRPVPILRFAGRIDHV